MPDKLNKAKETAAFVVALSGLLSLYGAAMLVLSHVDIVLATGDAWGVLAVGAPGPGLIEALWFPISSGGKPGSPLPVPRAGPH
jgi:hypothetical protein